LPSQSELASRYGVTRETVKSALRVLDRERLIVSRQGSGSFVRDRGTTSTDLTEFLRSAYDRPHVRIDYAGWRGETLSVALPESLDVIRAGKVVVKSLVLRLLLTDPAAAAGLPQPIAGSVDPSAVRSALVKHTEDAVARVQRTVEELVGDGLVGEATVDVRLHALGPTLKIYTLNQERSLIGFYLVGESSVRIEDRVTRFHRPSGWDWTAFDINDQTNAATFVEQARAWFESVWAAIAVEWRRSLWRGEPRHVRYLT
jgi:hypothetical protein